MTQLTNTSERKSPFLSDKLAIRHRNKRMFIDRLVGRFMNIGGMGVVMAIMLIFFYLLYEVYPLLESVKINKQAEYSLAGVTESPALDFLIDEQGEVGLRYEKSGEVAVFNTIDGEVTNRLYLPIPAGRKITAFSSSGVNNLIAAFGLDDGSVVVVEPKFKTTYPNDIRKITASLTYPLGENPLQVGNTSESVNKLAVQSNESGTTIVVWQGDETLSVLRLALEESMLGDEPTVVEEKAQISHNLSELKFLLLDEEQRSLYLANTEGVLHKYSLSDLDEINRIEKTKIVAEGDRLTQLVFLNGYISLLAGDSKGEIAQWFAAKNENGKKRLTKIRSFNSLDGEIRSIAVEHFRKGFIASDSKGQMAIFHTTAQSNLLKETVYQGEFNHLVITPRARGVLLENNQGALQFWSVENEYPEVSWHSLWGEVWYESYDSPEYIWQSSSSSDDFEPKFSLTPVAFGTIKAAFYAMLFAVPLALFGAIYTAYFMAPALRQVVKPTIEIMEALPTVILGFLAGLWLAPVLEENLAGVFCLLIILPIGILFFSRLWGFFPKTIRYWVPEGWQPMLLLPVVFFVGWFAFELGGPVEVLLFGGDIKHWLSVDMGIPFDQRNSIVVGVAMGFAVIPTIFSITEDAVFSVPKHLTLGSLALGATPWQTMIKVVILTASPGIFSAIMIGFGRAVGETMIVLMATGNTPIMDFSIFQGMRTLAANIAVEVPEAEVASTHYRILFLAALVLFAFTFIFNTLAELVRQRLRNKYSSL